MAAQDTFPYVLILKDGSAHTLFSIRDFERLVDEKMGQNAARWIEDILKDLEEAADETQQAIDSDLRNYEASLESNSRAFQELNEICGSMISDFNRERGRNRLAALRPWRDKVHQMTTIIGNQV